MEKSQVAIAKNGDAVEMAKAALELAGIGELCRGKEVLIKANLSGGPTDKKGAIVSRETTKGVLEYLKPFCKRLALGDGARMSEAYTREVLEDKTWAKALAEEVGVALVNLWDSGSVTVKVPRPMARPEWPVSKAALDFEMIGSYSVLKVNGFAGVTLAMKNFYSLIGLQKLHVMHPWVAQVLVDLNQILKPSFGIIDGVWGWEAGEAAMGNGRPIKADMVLASKDIVAVDAISALLIGRDPMQIKKFVLSQEVGLGIANPDQIEILGVPIEKARIFFEDLPAEQIPKFKQETIDAGIEAALV